MAVEPDPVRRLWMSFCLAIGIAIGAYSLWSITTHDEAIEIAGKIEI